MRRLDQQSRVSGGGSAALELLLVLPLLLLVILALVQVAVLASADQKLEAAATAGARVAARGGDAVAVEAAVRAVLGGDPRYANAIITATLWDELGDPLPAGALVTVRVAVPAQETIPYPQQFVGKNLTDQHLIAVATALKE